ncbi:MAG: hypothetical protein ACTS3F_08040 [Phycisphaerales bacterium]
MMNALSHPGQSLTAALAPLLDLQNLDLGGEGVRFGFERPLAAWAWLLIIVGIVALAGWSYHRLVGGRLARIALSGVRAAILLVIVLLITGPQLVQRTESREQDWVIVLIDRSASLTLGDVQTEPGAPRITREQQLRAALADSWAMWQELSRNRTIVWLGFDAGAFELETRRGDSELESIALDEADGLKTALGAALSQGVARAAARPLAAVVLVSDGRSFDRTERRTLRSLSIDGVPVHTVALGSPTPMGDIGVARVDAPSTAFVGDIVPVRIDLERLATRDELNSGSATTRVQLIDRATGMVLDETEVAFDAPAPSSADPAESEPLDPDAPPEQVVTRAAAVLTHRAEGQGQRDWEVRIASDRADLIPENDARTLSVALTDEPFRVLYIDGYPRWEQRFLRTVLIRERSIVSSNLLLAPNRRFTQEGNKTLESIPSSPEEWAEFTVVILGDVRPDVFTTTQLEFLKQHIAERGAGLIWIGGPGAMPDAWFDTPLAELLPIVRGTASTQPIGIPITVAPTDAASRLGVMQIGEPGQPAWPAEMTDASLGWPQLFFAQAFPPGTLKPTAEPLAMAVAPGLAEPAPIVLSMRYGAGRSLYVATDETWRWRYGRGEIRFERFWLQYIRMLARSTLGRIGQRLTFAAAPERAVLDQPVRIVVELLDQSLIDSASSEIMVTLRRDATPGSSDGVPEEIEVALTPAEGRGSVYETIWLPAEPGRWTASITDRATLGSVDPLEIVVAPPDDELRNAQADHAALQRLSAATGGISIPADRMGQLADAIPNREVRLVGERAESLWDTPLALILVLTLLLLEWVGRRLIRLV